MADASFRQSIITHLSKLGFETDEFTIHYYKVSNKTRNYYNSFYGSYMSNFIYRACRSFNSKFFNNYDFQYDPSDEEALLSILYLNYYNFAHFLDIFKKYTENKSIIDNEKAKDLLLNINNSSFISYLKSSPWTKTFSLEEKLLLESHLLEHKDETKSDYYDSINTLLGINIETDDLPFKYKKENRYVLNKIIKILLTNDKQYKLYTKLHLLTKKKININTLINRDELLDYLIKNGVNIDLDKLFVKYGEWKKFDKQKKLIENGYIDVNAHYNKKPIIYHLLENDSISTVKYMLENNCKINAPLIMKDGTICNNIFDYLKIRINNGPKCRQPIYSKYLMLLLDYMLKIKYNSNLSELAT